MMKDRLSPQPRRMKCKLPMTQLPIRYCPLLLLLLLLLLSFHSTDSTEIKWTPGHADPNNAAHTAPRSQKYWDKHGIKRPEYAKTDAEIANERGESVGGSAGKWLFVVPLLGAAGYFVHVRMGVGGHRLGGRHALFSPRVNDEEARQARLERFELKEH
jgi:hypothetical protein